MNLILTFFGLLFGQESTEPKLIVVRHAEAANNTGNFYNSNPENPNYSVVHLTEKGKADARKTAQNLKAQGFNDSNIAHVFVSPLPRTMETAEIFAEEGLFSKDKIVQDKRLLEQQAGDLEGRDLLTNPDPTSKQKYHMEKDTSVRERMLNFYADVADKYFIGNTLIVTHYKPAQELILGVTHEKVRLAPGEVKIIPLKKM